jgi:polyphosphate kinase
MPLATKQRATPAARPFNDPALFVNRELSLLEFQRRVLEEAQDPSNPLLERAKFLSILGSNLDEFFMVRVAGLFNQLESGAQETGPDGLTPSQQLDSIRTVIQQLLADAYACLRGLLTELAAHGIVVRDFEQLTEEQKTAANRYFHETLFPVLTPLAVDLSRPFPHISNLSLNLSVLIRDEEGEEHFARIKVPPSLPQLVPLTTPARRRNGKTVTLVWIEQLIRANLHRLFPGMEVLESHLFYITRDAEMAIQEIEADDLLETIEEGVSQRRFNSVVRMDVDEGTPDALLNVLKDNFEIDDSAIYRLPGPLALSRLRALAAVDRPELKDQAFTPAPLRQQQEGEDMFTAIRHGEFLLHHPFDSFQPVVDFLRAAAHDPDVLAIKMTLYRTGRNSPVVEALLEANEEGKQVAVVVELKARFDEESNIEWARTLERQGVHVVYGLVGLKVHSKVALVVRREGSLIRRYTHLSTGNYNAVTAHLYTDIGFFTTDPQIGEEASCLFNKLTGYSAKSDYTRLLVAPINLRRRIEQMISREIEHARAGREARIIMKINALVDPRIIRLLYAASCAGVEIDLLVRGICCLRPGLPGVSDKIRVTSIVGRFLEHSRIFYFKNGGAEEIYLGSADMMPRNINRRVEVIFPVTRPALLRQLRDRILAVYLQDNVKARRMNSDGTYTRLHPARNQRPLNAQISLLRVRR